MQERKDSEKQGSALDIGQFLTKIKNSWIPTCVGMTFGAWIPTCVGMTFGAWFPACVGMTFGAWFPTCA